jgi:hypothetical protein
MRRAVMEGLERIERLGSLTQTKKAGQTLRFTSAIMGL